MDVGANVDKIYIINPRGRRLNPMSRKEADALVKRGFIEVTEAEWSAKEYFPEKATEQKIQPYIAHTTSTQSRKLLKTRIV